MPTNLPSSFASAAAGQNASRAGGGRGTGDWGRRDGRPSNGTLTFRRASTTPLSQTSQQFPHENPVQPPALEPAYQPDPSPARYSKDELLEMYNHQQSANGDPSRLFIQGWNPGQASNGAARAWGKSNDTHVPQEPGACWDTTGDTTPVGLRVLTADEKEAFINDINSPLKPPTMNKDGNNQAVMNGRKTSVSQGAGGGGGGFGVSSPSSASRPGTRRRETLESTQLGGVLASPSAGRSSREEASFWFPRKGSELKDSEVEEPEPDQSASGSSKLPFGGLLRSNTSGSQGTVGNIWGGSSSTLPGGSAFGSFAIGSAAIGVGVGAPKPVQSASGGSRLAHLMPKDDSEGVASRQSEGQNPLSQQSWRTRTRTDTDPFGDDILSGSASLGGAQETSSVAPHAGRVGTLGTPVKGSTGDFGMSGLNLGGNDDGPASPSETNPFRSPPANDPHDHDDNESGRPFRHEQANVFNPLQTRPFGPGGSDGHDRSQTSSAKGFSSLGHISAWGVPGGPTSATPDRERTGFGGAFFNSITDMQSPALGNLGGVFGPSGASGMGSIGRGSKLGALFPAALQSQMSHDESLGDSGPDLRQANPLGAIGRGNFSMPMRDTESPIRSNRGGVFEELFPSSENNRVQNAFGSAESAQGVASSGAFTPVGGFGNAHQVDTSAQAGARTMVMPDRMRWVYLDPQGHVQGPFTGLEMNDWYKAHFFSPDLRVKKVEDPDFEPLGQLIRRIGNSREPFLVPQVGIAHGQPPQTSYPPAQPGGVVPPLSGVFPSFGRTLTAEEQNNLERRKQEEQFLMAQQRDFVMRQQAMSRFQGQPGLQHHSSAQSLQSQPSFGNIQSPIGMPGMQAPIGPMPPNAGVYFDPEVQDPQRLSGNGEPSGDEETAHLSATERQMLAALQQSHQQQQQPIGAPVEQILRSRIPDVEQLGEDPEGFKERLMEFNDLRAQHDAGEAAMARQEEEPLDRPEEDVEDSTAPVDKPTPAPRKRKEKKKFTNFLDHEDNDMSLTQQVQATQAAAAAAVMTSEPGMPMPFPPPTSTTPLPAPTAQRVRSNLPEQYSRSQSGSPGDDSNAPPPMAPWAKEPGNDSKKGPSLKEIQEAEARKAAKAEEAAAAIRRAALEQEAALLREKEKQAAASAAGLPATSTWGHTASPVATTSPWTKPAATKVPAPGLAATPVASKKTLAEIQAEEEKRKAKAEKAAVIAGIPTGPSKSYANLAGKTVIGSASASPAPPPGAGWAVVGASGKVKAPPTGPAATRSVSSAAMKASTPTILKPVSRPAPAAAAVASLGAMDEFRKWVNRELARGINVDNVNAFSQTLEMLPSDTEIIADAVYANSTTMDGRHFAEEYVRRKKLAEKGVISKVESSAPSTGGWSEVAKKSGSAMPGAKKEEVEMPTGFKVVPGRKKGKK